MVRVFLRLWSRQLPGHVVPHVISAVGDLGDASESRRTVVVDIAAPIGLHADGPADGTVCCPCAMMRQHHRPIRQIPPHL